MLGVDEDVGRSEEEETVLLGRSLVVGEKMIVDWLEEMVLEGRVLEVERMSDGRLETVDERLGRVDERLGTVEDWIESVDDRLGTVEERLGSVDDELGTTDDARELASLDDDSAGVVVLAAERDGEDAALEAWDEVGATELEGTDELAATVDVLIALELELATDEGRAAEADVEAVFDRMDETMELMLDSSALFVTVLTGTKDELTLCTEVMTDDEAGVVELDDSLGVVLVVGWLVVEELVLATNPLLTDVTVTPLTVTVVGRVTFAVESVTAVLPATVVVTVGAVQTEEKHEHAAETSAMARLILAAWAKTAKSSRARSSSMALSSSSWTCSLR